MRRTLTVLVTAAALLVPATAASASSNASCNSGQQRGPAGSTYNDKGNYAYASDVCGSATPAPVGPTNPDNSF